MTIPTLDSFSPRLTQLRAKKAELNIEISTQGSLRHHPRTDAKDAGPR
jgi:hypothetical protein